MALIVANRWLKTKKRTVLARSLHGIKKISFFAVQDGQVVKRSLDDELYIDFRIQDVHGDLDGKMWTPEVLEELAKQFNSHEYNGDIDHKYLDDIAMMNLPTSQLFEKMKYKPGIAKAVKAIYDNGELYIRTVIDKRYEKVLQKAKGVSIEAYTAESDNTVLSADLLGWSFIVDDTMANPRAVKV